jgi:sarcosine oxidase, subunit gamma
MTRQFCKRSPVHDLLEPLRPQWRQAQGTLVAWSFQSLEAEEAVRAELALCDLSWLPRISFKGPSAVEWLRQRGITVPTSVYEYSNGNGGALVIRADIQEVFVEDGPTGQDVAQLIQQHLASPAGVYRVERQDASFLLSGANANSVLVETCGHDFGQPKNCFVMTRVAGVSCAVLPCDVAGVSAFRLWLDCSYAAYLWEALSEIVRDHGGGVIGVASVFPAIADMQS